jgi:hypothetical protein
MTIRLSFSGFCLLLFLFSCQKNSNPPANTSNSVENNNPVNNRLSAGLIAYYPFNNNANDESGNNYNLTVKDAALTSNRFGEPSKAYSFNGTNAFMTIPKLLKADTLRQVTISVWVKTEQLANECILSFLPQEQISCSYLLGFDNSSSTYRTLHKMVTTASPYNCTTSMISDAITNPFNKWTHLVLVQKYYSENIALHRNDYFQYFNGNKLKVSSTTIGSNPMATSFSRGGTIGCNNNSGNNNFNFNFFKGSIDDVRIYDRALSDEEILQLYNLKE